MCLSPSHELSIYDEMHILSSETIKTSLEQPPPLSQQVLLFSGDDKMYVDTINALTNCEILLATQKACQEQF